MSLRNTPTQWGAVAKTLHWSTAVLIVAATATVWYILRLDYETQFDTNVVIFRAVMPWHKALGIFVIFAVVPRLVWRAIDPRPRLPATLPAWQVKLAAGVHHLIYLLIAASIVTGWGQLSANGSPANVFDWFVLPPIAEKNKELYGMYEDWHYWTSWILFWLAMGHAAVALKHHFADRNNVLRAMLPWGNPRP